MDLAQEAFLEAFAHMDRFDTSKPFGPWVYRIVHNRALNYVKRSGHRSAPRLSGDDVLARSKASDSHDAAGARLDREQLKNHLQVEVEKLPAKIKGAFVLRYLEDKSVKDVAEILAVPVNTVKTHLFRAREHLRQKLRWWFDE